jgi:hypothetical protein
MKTEITINGATLTKIQTEVAIRAICELYVKSNEADEKNTVRDLDEILELIPVLYQAIPQDLDC